MTYEIKWRLENVQRIVELYQKTYRQQSRGVFISSGYDCGMDIGGSPDRADCMRMYRNRYYGCSCRSDLRRRICRSDSRIIRRMFVPLPRRRLKKDLLQKIPCRNELAGDFILCKTFRGRSPCSITVPLHSTSSPGLPVTQNEMLVHWNSHFISLTGRTRCIRNVSPECTVHAAGTSSP